MKTNLYIKDPNKRRWLATRKLAGRAIDPAMALVYWTYGYVIDPYGLDDALPSECRCIGRLYFARNPESDIWVCFYDLPARTREALEGRPQQEEDFDWIFGDDTVETSEVNSTAL